MLQYYGNEMLAAGIRNYWTSEDAILHCSVQYCWWHYCSEYQRRWWRVLRSRWTAVYELRVCSTTATVSRYIFLPKLKIMLIQNSCYVRVHSIKTVNGSMHNFKPWTSSYLFRQKGSDASWEHNNEPPAKVHAPNSVHFVSVFYLIASVCGAACYVVRYAMLSCRTSCVLIQWNLL